MWKKWHIKDTCPSLQKKNGLKVKKEIRQKKIYISWEYNEVISSSYSKNKKQAHLSLMASHYSDSKDKEVSNDKPSYDELKNSFNKLHDGCLNISRMCTK